MFMHNSSDLPPYAVPDCFEGFLDSFSPIAEIWAQSDEGLLQFLGWLQLTFPRAGSGVVRGNPGKRHVSTLVLSLRRLSIRFQIVGCEQPTSDWNDQFQESQRLFALDSPRSVTLWQFHSQNRGRCLRIRGGGIAPSVPAGGWMRRNAPFTCVESTYSTSGSSESGVCPFR